MTSLYEWDARPIGLCVANGYKEPDVFHADGVVGSNAHIAVMVIFPNGSQRRYTSLTKAEKALGYGDRGLKFSGDELVRRDGTIIRRIV